MLLIVFFLEKFFAKNYVFHTCALVRILTLFLNTVAKIQKAMWKKHRQKKRTTCKHKIITHKSGKKEHSGSWRTLWNRVSKQCTNHKRNKQQPKHHHRQQETKATGVWETGMRVAEMALLDFLIPFLKRAEKKLQRRQGRTMELRARLNEKNRKEIRRKDITCS